MRIGQNTVNNSKQAFKGNIYTRVTDIPCKNHLCEEGIGNLINTVAQSAMERGLIEYENIDAYSKLSLDGLDKNGDVVQTLRVFLLDTSTKLGEKFEHYKKQLNTEFFWNNFQHHQDTKRQELSVSKNIFCTENGPCEPKE